MRMNQAKFKLLGTIVQDGMEESSRALSSMTDGGIALTDPRVQIIPLTRIPSIVGGPEHVMAATYLGIHGEINGHFILFFPPADAMRVADMLIQLPIGTTLQLGALERSALAEAANVCGSSLLNAIANRTGLRIVVTPPLFVLDMAGAILQAIVTDLYLSGEEVLMVKTGFNDQVPGHLLLMPDQESMVKLVGALETIQ